jgi:hypothetical protein
MSFLINPTTFETTHYRQYCIILLNDQLDALFFNVFISRLYMFRATSAHHQEDQLVSIHHLV